MQSVTVREFRDKADRWLKGKEPVLIVQRGKLAGVFFPSPVESLPIGLKRKVYPVLARQMRAALKQRRVREEEFLADFEAFRCQNKKPCNRNSQ